MDLTLTKRGDYAVRAAISLARHHGSDGYRKIREVAEEMVLPPRYTAQILALLAKAGLAEARAGRRGGYRLSRSPADVSLLEVVESAEGPLQPQRCTLRGGPCRWEEACPVHFAWAQASEAIRASLASASLASVAHEDESLERAEGRPARAHVQPTPRGR
jgi:Rrf2 family iron-sulfur cluster assembly transcriptional regulator